jgi:hypothetical protein
MRRALPCLLRIVAACPRSHSQRLLKPSHSLHCEYALRISRRSQHAGRSPPSNYADQAGVPWTTPSTRQANGRPGRFRNRTSRRPGVAGCAGTLGTLGALRAYGRGEARGRRPARAASGKARLSAGGKRRRQGNGTGRREHDRRGKRDRRVDESGGELGAEIQTRRWHRGGGGRSGPTARPGRPRRRLYPRGRSKSSLLWVARAGR